MGPWPWPGPGNPGPPGEADLMFRTSASTNCCLTGLGCPRFGIIGTAGRIDIGADAGPCVCGNDGGGGGVGYAPDWGAVANGASVVLGAVVKGGLGKDVRVGDGVEDDADGL
ncbi:hypothetical protein KEM56_003205 [Ascosphaera pollenicola]|nr:hypothetical protein KEM56_003205 [Ascosphaera pollenicola]